MRNSRAVRAILSLGMVVGLGATGTYAYWTDTATIGGTTITAGTIKLQAATPLVGPAKTVNDTAFMKVDAMVPGNTVAGIITVVNAGTAPLKYYMDATATNALGAALTVRVTGDQTTSSATSGSTCASASLAGSGTTFSAGLLGTAASPRLLGAGATEKFCVEATLPTGAASALQGTTSNVTFNFTGTSF